MDTSLSRPGSGAAHHRLGLAAHRAGRPGQAVTYLRAAARAEPSNPDYVGALAGALFDSGDCEPAARCYIHMIKQDALRADAHVGLARAREAQGNVASAIASIWQAVRLYPADRHARSILARLLRHLGYDLAAGREEKRAQTGAIKNAGKGHRVNIDERRRDEAEASRQLSHAFAAAGQYDCAESEILRAVIFDPDNAANLTALSDLYEQLGRLDEAVAALREALHADPSNAAAHIALGGILARMGELDAAEASLKSALEYMPGAAAAHLNLANIEMERGQLDKSIEHLARALAEQPDYVEAHNNRANILLLQGRYAEGWDEYEWRRRMPRGAPAELNIPDWRGQPLDSAPLYIIGEQAAGDAVMFATCLSELADRGGPVSLHCETRITGLMRRAFPWLDVSDRLPDDSDPKLRGGHVICLGSLPGLFRRSEADFARSQPYLVAEPSQVAEWRARYRALGDGIKVGFTWSGGKSHIQQRQRAICLPDWMPLFCQPGAHFIDLQFGAHDAARTELRQHFGIAPYRPAEIAPDGDMESFAAQIKALDLVISIDNTTVHFAGALGVPVWTLVPPSPSWRWQIERRDSPWYPSMELFRRAIGESWGAVLERIGEALAAHISGAERDGENSTDRQIFPGATPCGGNLLPPVATACVANN